MDAKGHCMEQVDTTVEHVKTLKFRQQAVEPWFHLEAKTL
jgi:hypothetical protein